MEKLQSQKKRALLAPPAENGETTATTGFGLTHAEAIQCLNMVPTEPVEIHLLVEDLPGRLSERQQEELLGLMSSYDTQKPKHGNVSSSPATKEAKGEDGTEPEEYEMDIKEDSKASPAKIVKEEQE